MMNRGIDRQPVFFADADGVKFGRRLAEVHERFGVETLAYCLMPNHYHLLIRLPGGGLAAAIHHLGSLYTRNTNDRTGRDGPLFRGRYHSIRVDTDEYLLWAARYIHRNPLALRA
jgi:putative transposase